MTTIARRFWEKVILHGYGGLNYSSKPLHPWKALIGYRGFNGLGHGFTAEGAMQKALESEKEGKS